MKQFSHHCTRAETEAVTEPRLQGQHTAASWKAPSCCPLQPCLLQHTHLCSYRRLWATEDVPSALCAPPLGSIHFLLWGTNLICCHFITSMALEAWSKLSLQVIFLLIPVQSLLQCHLKNFLPSFLHTAISCRAFLRPAAKPRMHFSSWGEKKAHLWQNHSPVPSVSLDVQSMEVLLSQQNAFRNC